MDARDIIKRPVITERSADLMSENKYTFDVDTRAKRIMERDGVSYDLALARISSQKTWDEYRALSDIVLDNSQDRNHLQEQLAIAWKTIE